MPADWQSSDISNYVSDPASWGVTFALGHLKPFSVLMAVDVGLVKQLTAEGRRWGVKFFPGKHGFGMYSCTVLRHTCTWSTSCPGFRHNQTEHYYDCLGQGRSTLSPDPVG